MPQTLRRRMLELSSRRRLHPDLRSPRLSILLCVVPTSLFSSIWHWRPACSNFEMKIMLLFADWRLFKRVLVAWRNRTLTPWRRGSACSRSWLLPPRPRSVCSEKLHIARSNSQLLRLLAIRSVLRS